MRTQGKKHILQQTEEFILAIQERMKSQGYSQLKLQELSGISQATISRILKRLIPSPDTHTIRALCTALGLSAENFLYAQKENAGLVVRDIIEPMNVELKNFPILEGYLIKSGLVSKEKSLHYNGDSKVKIWLDSSFWEERGIDPRRIRYVEVKEPLGGEYTPGKILFIQTGLFPKDIESGDEVLVRLESGQYQLRKWMVKNQKTYTVDMFDPEPIPEEATKKTVIFGKIVKKF